MFFFVPSRASLSWHEGTTLMFAVRSRCKCPPHDEHTNPLTCLSPSRLSSPPLPRPQCCEAIHAFACCLCLVLIGGPILIGIGASILAAANRNDRAHGIGEVICGR